jgi:ubiquinone/menaquinone biosynthesis C-methylase UbiE
MVIFVADECTWVTPERSLMETKSNIEWKMWGKTDPLWGVAAWNGKDKGGPSTWTDKEFYELGRSDWSDFIVHWEKYGVDREVGLEIGCGAGRLTAPMAEHFKTVHALDVSEGMIDYARKHVSAQNVSFHIVNGNTIPLPDASVTAVFSTHVFQHFDSPDDATSYFRETARVLRDRGSIMIHLPILIWPGDAPPWVRRAYQVRRTLSFARIRNALKRRAISKGRFLPFMSMRSYQLEYLFGTLRECGFRDIDILIFVTKSNNDPHPFVMARKGE